MLDELDQPVVFDGVEELGDVRDWPAIVTVVDMAWGTFLTAVIAAIGISLGRLLS
jgi:uncharacterized membrane protein